MAYCMLTQWYPVLPHWPLVTVLRRLGATPRHSHPILTSKRSTHSARLDEPTPRIQILQTCEPSRPSKPATKAPPPTPWPKQQRRSKSALSRRGNKPRNTIWCVWIDFPTRSANPSPSAQPRCAYCSPADGNISTCLGAPVEPALPCNAPVPASRLHTHFFMPPDHTQHARFHARGLCTSLPVALLLVCSGHVCGCYARSRRVGGAGVCRVQRVRGRWCDAMRCDACMQGKVSSVCYRSVRGGE
jgi:hypothetical protein